MKYLKKFNENFDIINNDLKHEIKEYLLTNYPSQWWENNSDINIIKNDIRKKFILTDDDFCKNNIDKIINIHKNNMNINENNKFIEIRDKIIRDEMNFAKDERFPNLKKYIKKLNMLKTIDNPKEFVKQYQNITDIIDWELPDDIYQFL